MQGDNLCSTCRALAEARKLIMKGCDLCPTSEDVWLEAARLQTPEHAKALLARGVGYNQTSVKLWIQVRLTTMGVSLEKYSSPEVSLSIGSIIICGNIGPLDLFFSFLHFRRAPVHCVVVCDACADELQAIRALMQRVCSFCYLRLPQCPFSPRPSAGFLIALLFAGRQARAGPNKQIPECLGESSEGAHICTAVDSRD